MGQFWKTVFREYEGDCRAFVTGFGQNKEVLRSGTGRRGEPMDVAALSAENQHATK